MAFSNPIPPEECTDCGPFLLDVAGAFPEERIRVVSSPDRRDSNPEVEAVIEKTWIEEIAAAHEAGRHLYNGRLYRLAGWACEGGVLTLTLGPTSFKEFMGTNLTHAYLRYLYGPEVLADVLGVSAAVCTADGFVLLGRRSEQVALHRGRIQAIGGVMEAAAHAGPRPAGEAPDSAAPPHPTRVTLQELREEIGIGPDQVRSILCLGMVREKHIVQPELIFDAEVVATADQVLHLQAGAEHGEEHAELVPVRDDPAGVVAFLEQNYADLTPVAMATLLLHGLHRWGSGWFATTRGYLRGAM